MLIICMACWCVQYSPVLKFIFIDHKRNDTLEYFLLHFFYGSNTLLIPGAEIAFVTRSSVQEIEIIEITWAQEKIQKGIEISIKNSTVQ